jgi:hypothetical protein
LIPHRNRLLLAIALGALAVGVCVALLVSGTERRPDEEASRAPAPTRVAPSPAVATIQELVPVPTVAATETLGATTVLWPLRVELELVRAGHLPSEDGTPELGSGADARLSGRIGDRGDGGVRATLLFESGPNEGRELTTDASGALGASDLQPGLSLVSISGPGLVGARRLVRLRAGAETLLNLGFGRPAAVFGHVQDREGQPIEGAQVLLDGQRRFSDENGDVYYPTVAPGEAWVEVSREGFAAHGETAFLTAGAVLGGEQKLVFTLQAAARLKVVVTESVGSGPVQVFLLPGSAEPRPIGDAHALFQRFPWESVSPLEVWPDRPALVEGLPARAVRVLAFRAGARGAEKVVSLQAGKETTVELPLAKAPALTGRVLLDGEPVGGAHVMLEAPNRSRATLAFFRESRAFLESTVLPVLPVASQETRTGSDGRFTFSAWSELAPVRYLQARGPDGRNWGARLVHAGDESVDLELESLRVGDAELVVDLPGRFQGLPIELVINGQPFDPFVLEPHDPLRVEHLLEGTWRVRASWHAEAVGAEQDVLLERSTALELQLPKDAIEGQDEEQWLRAGRTFPFASGADR